MMFDWDLFQRYAMLAFSIIALLIIIMLIVSWYRNAQRQKNGVFVLPNPPMLIQPAPSLIQRPPMLPMAVPGKKHHGQAVPTSMGYPTSLNTTYTGDLNKYGKNPVCADGDMLNKHHKGSSKNKKGRRNSSDDSSSSSSSSDEYNGNPRLTIEPTFWYASFCAHSRKFWTVWKNVEKRFKKHNQNSVKIVFKQKMCDGKDRQEWQSTLVDGHPVAYFPTVSIAVQGRSHQQLTDHVITEDELEHKISDFIRMKKQEIGCVN